MFYAKKVIANAIRLSHMAELIETQGISALNDYFRKNNKKIKNNTANKSLKELFHNKEIKQVQKLTLELYSKGFYHPKIKKLEELLSNQINQNAESRILVFCHFRDSVNNIVKYFEENDRIQDGWQ